MSWLCENGCIEYTSAENSSAQIYFAGQNGGAISRVEGQILALRGLCGALKADFTEFRERQKQLVQSGGVYAESAAFIKEFMADAPGCSFGAHCEQQVGALRALVASLYSALEACREELAAARAEAASEATVWRILDNNFVFKSFTARVTDRARTVQLLGEHFLALANSVGAAEMQTELLEAQVRDQRYQSGVLEADLENEADKLQQQLRELQTGASAAAADF